LNRCSAGAGLGSVEEFEELVVPTKFGNSAHEFEGVIDGEFVKVDGVEESEQWGFGLLYFVEQER
jgi:hypothetical protein